MNSYWQLALAIFHNLSLLFQVSSIYNIPFCSHELRIIKLSLATTGETIKKEKLRGHVGAFTLSLEKLIDD